MRTFLIVDDSETIRMGLEKALRAAGGRDVEIHGAEDRTAAVKLFEDLRPDCVFLDMVFPDEEHGTRPDKEVEEAGLGILREMLRIRPGATIVLVTGLPSNHPDVVDAINLGAAAWLRKPIRPDDVRALLDSLGGRADLGYIM